MKKGQKFSEALPHQLPPRLCYEPVVERAAPLKAHLSFTTFKNSVFVQKQTLVELLG